MLLNFNRDRLSTNLRPDSTFSFDKAHRKTHKTFPVETLFAWRMEDPSTRKNNFSLTLQISVLVVNSREEIKDKITH